MKREIIITTILASIAGVIFYFSPSGGELIIEGRPYEITSGPAWLVKFMYTSSYELRRILMFVVAIGVILLGWAYNRIRLTLQERKDLLQNAITVLLMGGSAWVLSNIAPYWIAVSGGSIGGAIIATILKPAITQAAQDWHNTEKTAKAD